MKKEKGIDYSKDNVYDAIGRPDLKPKIPQEKIGEAEKEKLKEEIKNIMFDWTDNKIDANKFEVRLEAILAARDSYWLKRIEKLEKIIKSRLKYCQEQNGLPYCKNCGLKESDLPEI